MNKKILDVTKNVYRRRTENLKTMLKGLILNSEQSKKNNMNY